jgi:hypothetical protein
METQEYRPGETVPVTSSLYRVMHDHDSPDAGALYDSFFEGDRFPSCPECGKKVRYLISVRVLRKKSSSN